MALAVCPRRDAGCLSQKDEGDSIVAIPMTVASGFHPNGLAENLLNQVPESFEPSRIVPHVGDSGIKLLS